MPHILTSHQTHRLRSLLTLIGAHLRRPLRGRLGALLLIMSCLALCPLTAYAATITVDGTTCTLPNAITAANTNTTASGCSAGSGADTLILSASTYTLTATAPDIDSTIVISGGVSGATIVRSGSNQFSLLTVGASGDLTLQHVTLRNGNSFTYGGAIYNHNRLTVIDSTVISNFAAIDGGGIFNLNQLTVTNGIFISNTAASGDGGGILNHFGATATITGTQMSANKASRGGAIASAGTLTVTNTILNGNSVTNGGGGYWSGDGTATFTNVQVSSNHATNAGGGLWIQAGTANLTASSITSNSASGGGAIYNEGILVATTTVILNNTGNSEGALVQQGATTINQSCIVNNSDPAVFRVINTLDASNNWWGAADGPSGAGPGSGDSVNSNVTFSPFLTSAPSICPGVLQSVVVKTTQIPAGTLLPGQPVTFTVTITNNSGTTSPVLFLQEYFDKDFVLKNVMHSNKFDDVGNDFYISGGLSAHQSTVQSYAGVVSPTLSADGVLTHTSTLHTN